MFSVTEVKAERAADKVDRQEEPKVKDVSG